MPTQKTPRADARKDAEIAVDVAEDATVTVALVRKAQMASNPASQRSWRLKKAPQRKHSPVNLPNSATAMAATVSRAKNAPVIATVAIVVHVETGVPAATPMSKARSSHLRHRQWWMHLRHLPHLQHPQLP